MTAADVVPYLTDIVDASERIRQKMADTSLEAFKQDWEKQWLIERGMQIVSEASRRLSGAYRRR